MGRTISVISIQSKKNPSRNTTSISSASRPQGPSPVPSISRSTASSPPSDRNTREKAVAPTKIPNSMPPVSALRSVTSRSRAGNLPSHCPAGVRSISGGRNRARIIAPNAPTPAASVGEAQPARIDPSTSTISAAVGSNPAATSHASEASPVSASINAGSGFGASAGFIVARSMTKAA